MYKQNKSILWVLIKKQITQTFSFTKSKKSVDFLGLFIYLLLICALAYVFLSVFSGFIDVYCNVKFYGVPDFKARQYELLSIAYLVAFLLITFSSIGSINKTIFENEDIKILTAMPISSTQLFWSKMIVVYVKQILVAAVTIIPINTAFAMVAAQPVYYYFITLAVCFILPLLTISIAAVLALPVYYIKSFLSNRYVLMLIIISVITTLACAGYALLIDKAKYLVVKGAMKFVLNEGTMDLVAAISKYAYPANFFAGLVVKKDVLLCILCILGISAACVAISIFVINSILNKTIQNRITRSAKPVKMFRSVKQKRPLSALIAKEFNTIFRTPSYTFLYFSMAIALPVMASLCMTMGKEFISTIINVPINFEIALFLTLIFGVLTNTFCATNISRDGVSFFTAKALPISIKQIIMAKIMLCGFVTVLSNFLCVLIYCIIGYTTVLQGLYIFVVAILMGFAQICFATRLDFNRPKFSALANGQIKDSNTTMSIIIVAGLSCAMLIGFSTLYLATVAVLSQSSSFLNTLSKYLVVAAAVAMAAGGYLFLTANLEKKYYNFIGCMDYE